MSNQCDGCMRGLPIKDGIHYDGEEPYMVCTKDRYQPERRREMSETVEELITEEQKQEYLKSYGVLCPYCKSANITSLESPEADLGGASQKIECRDCGAEWWDIYDLIDIEIIKEGRKL